MQWIDRNKLRSGLLAGTFLNLGSPTAVEIAADTGFDCGILTKSGFEQQHMDLGFKFVATGSDTHAVVQAMQSNLATLRQ